MLLWYKWNKMYQDMLLQENNQLKGNGPPPAPVLVLFLTYLLYLLAYCLSRIRLFNDLTLQGYDNSHKHFIIGASYSKKPNLAYNTGMNSLMFTNISDLILRALKKLIN